MTFGELKRLLRKKGCYLDHQGGRHEIWYSPKTGKYFQLGRHNTEEVANGTLNNIKRTRGLNKAHYHQFV